VQRAQIDEFEMALLANLTPETADEALSIIPSLQVRCHVCMEHHRKSHKSRDGC
jgi:hypothetical protein